MREGDWAAAAAGGLLHRASRVSGAGCWVVLQKMVREKEGRGFASACSPAVVSGVSDCPRRSERSSDASFLNRARSPASHPLTCIHTPAHPPRYLWDVRAGHGRKRRRANSYAFGPKASIAPSDREPRGSEEDDDPSTAPRTRFQDG